MSEFEKYLKIGADEIDLELKKIFADFKKEISIKNPSLIPLLENFFEANFGGKRIRGVLVKLGYELAINHGTVSDDLIKVACAYEIFQTAILAHDDVIDQAQLRRGKPSLPEALGGGHYGLSQAICLGDLGFFWAINLISKTNLEANVKTKVLEFFSQTMMQTTLGEILDTEILKKTAWQNEESILKLIDLKTAKYTFIGPLSLGVILGGGGIEKLKLVEKFGQNLGLAFQIRDDILGVFGTEKEVGKSVSSDTEEGKITLLYTFALNHTTKKDQVYLKKVYGRGKISETDLEKIKEIFTSSGALEYCQDLALRYITEAKTLIPQITKSKINSQLLERMADYLMTRNK